MVNPITIPQARTFVSPESVTVGVEQITQIVDFRYTFPFESVIAMPHMH